MSTDREVLATCLGQALSGRSAHTATAEVFDGLDWELAGSRPLEVTPSNFIRGLRSLPVEFTPSAP